MAYDDKGPHLQMAVLCERALQEKDGVLSVIRVVDRTIVTVTAPNAPEQMPPFNHSMTLVISFKAGAARGRQTLKIVPEDPAGQSLKAIELPVLFEGEDKGVNQTIQYTFTVNTEGLYWFDVFLDSRLVTRMPLRVVYNRIQTS